jgi:hypothetical protein
VHSERAGECDKGKAGPMAKIKDVAAYILKQTGPITAMKLQKLVY